MIEDLKSYPEYKDSGLPWLGEVPVHWEIVRSKRLFRQRKEFANTEDQQLSATQAYGVIPQALYEKRTGYRVVKISMHLDKRKHVEADDFVISMRSFQGGLERAWAAGAIRSSYVVLEPSAEVSAGYFQHLFKSHQYINALRATSDFIRDGQDLNFGNFCGVALPLIPLQEQASIARFLAWATNRLDRAIGAKRRIIALLQEQKQAIIHRAVTRGLDPSVPLKDSGIPWLGEIPEHWEVRRLKYLTEGIQMGPFGASLTELQEHDTGYKLYGQENTISGDFFSGKRWLSKEQFTALQRYELLPGDLVLTRKGSIGKCKIVPEKTQQGIADSDTIRVRLNHNRLLNDFGLLLLQDAMYIQRQIQSIQRGAILVGLNTATISNLRLAAPPPSEQKPILTRIQAETTGISSTMQAKSREIDPSLPPEIRRSRFFSFFFSFLLCASPI
jgi:type I restriction enzyme S subunit